VTSAHAVLDRRALNRATLARQGLIEPIRARNAASAVARVGSLQAQHPEWPPVALAARASNARVADLAGALQRRQVVRSSLMRLTIHVVSADDLWPMFVVCQPLRLQQWRLIMKADPIDSPLGRRMRRAHEVAIQALREGPRSSLELDRLMSAEVGPAASSVTRPAWRQPDARVGVRAAWRHLSAFIPLVHVPHAGEGYGRSQYALATDWLGREAPKLDAALARVHVARRYLSAFGPASIEDLLAYVGRGKGGIGAWRTAVGALGDAMTLADEHGRTLYDLAEAPRPPSETPVPPRLLARWDSLLLSHATRARDRVIADADRAAVFSRNADVLPTFLIDGFVAGTWELTRSNVAARVVLRPFRRLARRDADALLAEAERVLAHVAPAEVERTATLARAAS
jgi:hypothetical protein